MDVAYLALIYLQPGKAAVLRAYEAEAARVMRRHGGMIERVYQPLRAGQDGPDEVHLLRFASAEGFAAFRADPELRAHLALRDEAVRAAEIYPLREIGLDEYFAAP